MKPKKCVLRVNNRWGYIYTPQEYASIADAVRAGKGFPSGFWWAVSVDGKEVRHGYCNRD